MSPLYVHGGRNGFRYDTWLLGHSEFIRGILEEGLIGVHEAGTRTHLSKLGLSLYWYNLDVETRVRQGDEAYCKVL
jgi:hypothetical protein